MLVIFRLGSEHQLVSGSFNIENFIYIGSSMKYNGCVCLATTYTNIVFPWMEHALSSAIMYI